MFRDLGVKNGDPCSGIFCQKPTHLGGTSPYSVSMEVPPPPPGSALPKFTINALLMCPHHLNFKKILHFQPCFGQNFSSQDANFPNVRSQYPYLFIYLFIFLKKTFFLGPTFRKLVWLIELISTKFHNHEK